MLGGQPQRPAWLVTTAASGFMLVSGAALLMLVVAEPYTVLGALFTVLAGLPLYYLLQKASSSWMTGRR